MEERTVRNLVIALVVILALYGVLRWQQNHSFEPAKPKGFNLSAITKENTKNITVKSDDLSYKITNKLGKWQLKGIEISNSAIDELFNGLKETDVQEVAATKKAKFSSLGVDDTKGKLVVFQTKKNKLSFIFGKAGANGSSFYIRRPKGNKAYIARGNLGSVFAKNINDWYDKEILNISQNDIEKITFNTNDNTFNLNKEKKQWFIKENKNKEKADTNKVENLLTSLSMITANSVVAPKKDVDFSKAETITIYGKKNKILAKLELKNKGKKEFYIKNTKKKYTFIIDKTTAKNIRKKSDELK